MVSMSQLENILESSMGFKMWNNLSAEQKKNVRSSDQDSLITDYHYIELYSDCKSWNLIIRQMDPCHMYQLPRTWSFNITTKKSTPTGSEPPSTELLQFIDSNSDHFNLNKSFEPFGTRMLM